MKEQNELSKYVEEARTPERWNRFFNPMIMSVMCEYAKNPNQILFAATGDLDSLGVYVATNGRAQAENLVDLYNQATRNYCTEWHFANKKEVHSFAFVPSGEEAFILGTCDTPEVASGLFNSLVPAINSTMKAQTFIDIAPTRANFGGTLITDLHAEITNVANSYNSGEPDHKVVPHYLQALQSIRTQTAEALDKAKFSDILKGEHPIQARQIALAFMLNYKTNAAETLRSLDGLSEEKLASVLALAGNQYGITLAAAENLLRAVKTNQ